MNKKILGLALVSTFSTGMVQAATFSDDAFFGTFGSTVDVSTDVNTTLSVGLFGGTAAGLAGKVLTNAKVEVRGSLSTEGTYTNNGSVADVSATVIANGGAWQATTSGLAGADHVFGANFLPIINENLGTVAGGVSGSFGVFTNDSAWLSVFDGLDAAFLGLGDLDFLFETHTASFITGSSNFASAFTTGTAGGLRVTYTFEDATVSVPEPASLALMGLGLGLMGVARRNKKA